MCREKVQNKTLKYWDLPSKGNIEKMEEEGYKCHEHMRVTTGLENMEITVRLTI